MQNFRGSRADQTGLFPDVYAFNFEPFNKLILPLERRTAAAVGDVEVSDKVELYGQALFARYTAQTSLAPTPAPTDTNRRGEPPLRLPDRDERRRRQVLASANLTASR